MKKNLLSWLTIAMMATVCVGFSACSSNDDDDEEEGGGGGSAPGIVEAVDLGLPSGTKWANMNVGASKASEYGTYFCWGETSGKEYYSSKNYKWRDNTTDEYTKYDDNNPTLEAADDAATANWGSSWCMPTETQLRELIANCTWTWTTENNIPGYMVSGSNGKSIFLPAGGHRTDGNATTAEEAPKEIDSLNEDCEYWTASLRLGKSKPSQAIDLEAKEGKTKTDSQKRDCGLLVRPVKK